MGQGGTDPLESRRRRGVFHPLGKQREARSASFGGTRSAAWIPGLDDVSRDGRFLDTGMLSENYRGVIRARVPDEPEERSLSWLGRSVAVDLSADGKQLLLYEEGSDPERQEEVFTTYLRPTDGSDATRVGDGRALALSPNGQWALVVRSAPETHLVLLPVGEGEPKRLPGSGLLYRRAVFFPDGRRILYNADDKEGTAHTYIQDVEGAPPRQIGKEGMFGTLVSPDGRTVTLLTREGPYFFRQKARKAPGRSAARSGATRPIVGAPTVRRSTCGRMTKSRWPSTVWILRRAAAGVGNSLRLRT